MLRKVLRYGGLFLVSAVNRVEKDTGKRHKYIDKYLTNATKLYIMKTLSKISNFLMKSRKDGSSNV